MRTLYRLIVSILIAGSLFSQIRQQDFLDPAKVRRSYRIKDFKAILFIDEEVFPKNPGLEEREYIETSGFRVQLISTQDINEALKVRTQADSLYNLPVYIDFESPNYKVRIGNYATNDEALMAQRRMQNQGFKFAWVVPSKVILVK
ncbi:MAG: SPOR domain-containing protein [FCB group bacterium]|nr:SPOR domain-containing protein [FCB group bacterium]